MTSEELQNTQLAILRELRDINRFLCAINASLLQIIVATGTNDGVSEETQKNLLKFAEVAMEETSKRIDNRPKI